jgi:hypothetical protein
LGNYVSNVRAGWPSEHYAPTVEPRLLVAGKFDKCRRRHRSIASDSGNLRRDQRIMAAIADVSSHRSICGP